jgi:hypothetical protein
MASKRRREVLDCLSLAMVIAAGPMESKGPSGSIRAYEFFE